MSSIRGGGGGHMRDDINYVIKSPIQLEIFTHFEAVTCDQVHV